MVPVPAPVRPHPDRAGMRTGRPVAAMPHPMAAPFPAAWNPKPQIQRTGCRHDDVGLQRRRLAGVGRSHLARRGSWTVTINHTARHHWQNRSQQEALENKGFFHNHFLRRGCRGIVSLDLHNNGHATARSEKRVFPGLNLIPSDSLSRQLRRLDTVPRRKDFQCAAVSTFLAGAVTRLNRKIIGRPHKAATPNR